MAIRYYTLQEANGLVPWIDSIFRRLIPMRKELEQEQEAMTGLLRKSRSNGHSSKEEELQQRQRKIDDIKKRAAALLAELEQRGIVVRDPDRGLIDFYSKREGRDVFLCWILNEDTIGFWHELDTGFTGRQPL